MGVNAHNVDIRRLPGHTPPLNEYEIYSSGAQFYIWHNRLLKRSLIEYPFKVSSTALLRDHIQSYIWRHNHQVLVSTLYFKQEPQEDKYSIFYERVLTNLSRIKDLCFEDSLQFYYAGLKGFQLLWQKYGYFQIKEEMFHVTEEGKAKVWCDRNISKIFPASQPGSEQKMVSQIARVLQSNTDQSKCKIHVGNELRKQSCDTFQKAINHFVLLCKKSNYELSSKLKCMYTIYMGGVENIVDEFGPTEHPLKDRYIKNPEEQLLNNVKENAMKHQNVQNFTPVSPIKIEQKINSVPQNKVQPKVLTTYSLPKQNYSQRSQSVQLLHRSKAINTSHLYSASKSPLPQHQPVATRLALNIANHNNTPVKMSNHHIKSPVKQTAVQSSPSIRIPSNMPVRTPRQSITPLHILSQNKDEQVRRASLSPGIKFNQIDPNNHRNMNASRHINMSSTNIQQNNNRIAHVQPTKTQNAMYINNAGQSSHRYFPINSSTSIKIEPNPKQETSSRVHKVSKLQLKSNFEQKSNQQLQHFPQTQFNTKYHTINNINNNSINNNNNNNINNNNNNVDAQNYANIKSINENISTNFVNNTINNISNPSLQFSLKNIETPKQSKPSNFDNEVMAESKFVHRNAENNGYTFKLQDNTSQTSATNFKSSPVIHRLKFKTREQSNQSKLDERVNNFSAILEKLKEKYCSNMESSSNLSKLVSPTETYTKRLNQEIQATPSQQFINVFSYSDNTLYKPQAVSSAQQIQIQKPVQYTISVHVSESMVKQETFTIHNHNASTNNAGIGESKLENNQSTGMNSKNKKKYFPDIDEDIWKDMLRLKNKNSPAGS